MEWDSWFQGKTFTTDWSSCNFSNWVEYLAPLRARAVRVLEIGSWEGRSAIFFLEYMPQSRITCVDTFEGGSEHTQYEQALLSTIERRFDANLSSYGDRVRKLKSRSLSALDRLAQENRTFDLVYIDGSHLRDDVMIDSILAWRLLAPGGICIWDDYIWGARDLPSTQRPQHAIDAFLDMHLDELEIRHAGAQVIVEKRPGNGAERRHYGTFPRTFRNLRRFLTRKPMRP